MQQPPEHVQFDHEWHDRAVANLNMPTLIVAGVIGWVALLALALLVRFLAHILGAT